MRISLKWIGSSLKPSAMASALHRHLVLRCLSAAPRRPNLSLSPQPARLRFSFPAPACRLVTHAVALAEPEWQQEEEVQFVVVTFYKFVPVEDPRAEVASHLHFLQGHDIHGRIYLNEQGINAQYSGPRKDAMAYADWLRKDPRFCDMLVQTSPALSGHAFPRLKLRYKSSLVQTMNGILGIFKELSGLMWTASEALPLGSRRRKKGFRNLYTLEGGVSNYLKAEGSAGWVGNLFVFDDRLLLPPATFGPRSSEEAVANGSSSRWVGRCYACGSEVVKLRHRNCANIDCNRLYLCCGWCAEDLGGCCCSECKTAPRLRPLLPGHQRYMKWHVYRDGLLLEAATGREEDEDNDSN